MKWKSEVVVSSISGRLLCPISEVYEFLDWFLRARLFTHQLPSAGEFASPYVLMQCPTLEIWVEDAQKENFDCPNWQKFRNALRLDVGEVIQIQRLPPRVFRQRDPIEELQEMAPGKPIIVVKGS